MRRSPLRGPCSVLLAAAALLTGCARDVRETISRPRRIAFAVPRDCAAAPGATRDAATGLPTRVVHEPSGIPLALIPAGVFRMGEKQRHRVISRPFYLGIGEVTTGQFRRFADASGYLTDAERGTPDGQGTVGGFAATADGNREWNAATSWRNPWPNLGDAARAFRHTDEHPVVHASWNDAVAFCHHYGFKLPSEAQWEYACRAGRAGRFFWGDDPAGGAGRCNVQDRAYGRRFPNANAEFPFDDGHALLAPSASQRPNAWGLHDMIGNLEEWCEDDWQRDIPADGADESAVVGAGERASGRVLRGGSWLGDAGMCNTISRPGFSPAGRRDFIGFRVMAEVIVAPETDP